MIHSLLLLGCCTTTWCLVGILPDKLSRFLFKVKLIDPRFEEVGPLLELMIIPKGETAFSKAILKYNVVFQRDLCVIFSQY